MMLVSVMINWTMRTCDRFLLCRVLSGQVGITLNPSLHENNSDRQPCPVRVYGPSMKAMDYFHLYFSKSFVRS